MRKLFPFPKLILVGWLMFPGIVLAQWERWEPWTTELGITPYADMDFRIATPETLGTYEINYGGMDLKVAMQVCLPPLYIHWGFSNLLGGLLMRDPDTNVVSPVYINMRTGLQVTYEDVTTYDVSLSFIKTAGTDLGFTAFILEVGYGWQFPLQVGALQVFGTLGPGITKEVVPRDGDEAPKDKRVLNLSLGIFWRTNYVVPYLYGGVGYPWSEEGLKLDYFIALGLQLVFPRSYVKGIPDIAYPKKGTKKK